MDPTWNRRQWMLAAPALLGAGAAAGLAQPAADAQPSGRPAFRYCLNTSTIMGQKLDLVELVEITAKAGYDAIEPWVSDLERYAQGGHSLRDVAVRLRDRGLTVESAIGFPEWVVDDPARRKKGLEDARRAMELVRQVGGKRLAAPPAGATNVEIDPRVVAERYRALLELGEQAGVVPQAEIWGFSRTLRRLGEAALAALETGRPDACILADVYHLYKGGSGFNGLRLLSANALHVVHFNDYPAQPPRESIADAQRVYPGDGVAPLKQVLRDLRAVEFRGVLSLELFNRDYWKQDALAVARTGLEKMRALARASAEASP